MDNTIKTLPDETSYCRKCMKVLPVNKFYQASDAGMWDANLHMSVCKKCIQDVYDEIYVGNNSMEETLHKLCTSLNVMFSNEAVSATRKHIQTLLDSGKNVRAIFSIYKMKLTATKKSMSKKGISDMSYEDVGTIYTERAIDVDEVPIPKEVIERWGAHLERAEVLFLENQYINFKKTHKADTYTEIVLLKQICYALLDIENARKIGDEYSKLSKTLQDLMKSAEVSPNVKNNSNESNESKILGLWTKDIEQYTPAQWLKKDPRGDMYRDIGNVELYFQNYIVRPLKNFIGLTKEFNIIEEDNDEDYDNEEMLADDLNILGED